MNSYNLYVLDHAGRVIDSLPFKTATDDEACALALHVAGERRFELWHEKRRVHCSHEGPSVLDNYLEIMAPLLYGVTPAWFSGPLRA